MALGIAGASIGEFGRISRGGDSYGNVCGQGVMQDLPMTYFPVPLQSMEVALCLAACPLESLPEAICIYGPEMEQSEEQICYDAYPSRPVFSAYCLPAQELLRAPVLHQLLSDDQSVTFLMRDIIEGKLSLGMAVVGSSIVALCCILCAWCFGYLHKLTHFAVYAEMAYICYSVYIQAERDEQLVCEDYKSIHMENCSVQTSGYKGIFYACIGYCWVSLMILARIYQHKNEFLPLMKAMVSKGSISIVADLQWFVLYGFAWYVLFLILAISQSTIGANTTPSEITAFSFPIQTWSFSIVSRILLLLPFFTVFYLFIVLSQFALLLIWAKTKLKKWKAAGKKCLEEYGNWIYWKDYAPDLAVLYSVLPYCQGCVRDKWLYPPFVNPTDLVFPEPPKENEGGPFVAAPPRDSPPAPPQIPLYPKDFISVNMALWPLQWCIQLSAPVIVFACSNNSKEVTCPILLAEVSGVFSFYLALIVKSYYLGLAHSGPITPITSTKVVPITNIPLEIGSKVVGINEN